MRTRKRVAFVLAAAGALGVGSFAFAGSASAFTNCVPPTPNTTAGNQSCINGQIVPSTGLGSTFHNISLYTHVATRYLHPGDKANGGFAHTVSVLYDSDGTINPGTIPKCSTSALAGKNIAQAWATCGPGAGAAHNAYLTTGPPQLPAGAPPTATSGRASTAPPSNFNGCTLIFNGPTVNGNPTDILYTRVTLVPNGTANCLSPATNTSGNSTVILQGKVLPAGVSGFGKKLVTTGIDALPLPLDDFYATVNRGSYVQARCTHSLLRQRGIFVYSGTTQATDTANFSQPCS